MTLSNKTPFSEHLSYYERIYACWRGATWCNGALFTRIAGDQIISWGLWPPRMAGHNLNENLSAHSLNMDTGLILTAIG